jgi:predicted DNA-binding protein
MTTQMIIRIDPETKDKLTQLARMEGKSTSQLVRNVIEDYVEEHDISAYIDDLWDRIGNKLRLKGLKFEDIEKVIEDERRNKA